MNLEALLAKAGRMFLPTVWLGNRIFMSSSNQLSGVRFPQSGQTVRRSGPRQTDKKLPIRKTAALSLTE